MTRRAAAVIVALAAAACGAPSTSPSVPAPASPPTPTASVLNLSGRWSGTGSDPQGAEQIALTMTQSDTGLLTGTADLKPLNAADGSCASCHKFKSGTFTGSVSGATVAMKIVFPAGGDGVPTPMCTITFDLSAAGVTGDRVNASYAGDDSCEGAFTGGTLAIARQ